jgi:hypothetical protein
MLRNVSSLLLFVLIPASLVRSQQERELIDFFPGKKIFPSFTADPLTHQISLSHILENRDWIGTIGGSIPLAQVNLNDVEVQASLAGSTFNRLITPPGLTVYTIDFKVDFPVDVRFEETSFRFALGHYSCHFADDGIEILGKHSIQYVKDYAMLGIARDIPLIGGHAYLAGHWVYHNVPVGNKNWALQLGGEGGNVSVTPFVQFYCAVDLKLRQEISWGSTQSYQIGARLFTRGLRSLRIAYTLRQGFDERGQFFDQHEDANIISAFIDF